MSTALPLEFRSASGCCEKAANETCAKSLIHPATHHFTITTALLQMHDYSESVASFLLTAADVFYVKLKPSL